MPVYAKRVFRVRIPEDAMNDLERFLDRINRAIRAYGALVRIQGRDVIIEVYGTKSMIRDSWIQIKRVLSQYNVSPDKGVKLSRLYRDVGLAVPADVLAEVLRAYGYRAESNSETLYTDAPYEDVLDAAFRVKDAINALSEVYATRTAKRAVAALSAIWGEPPQRVIEKLLATGYARLGEDGKLELIKPWREVVAGLRRRPENAGESEGP